MLKLKGPKRGQHRIRGLNHTSSSEFKIGQTIFFLFLSIVLILLIVFLSYKLKSYLIKLTSYQALKSYQNSSRVYAK